MADAQDAIKENFAKNFKASEYFDELHSNWKNGYDIFRFMMKWLHEVFHSGQFRGSKLLDIGSGATVHAVASASAYFSNIVLSDYVEDNIEQLKRWLKGESNLKQLLEIPAGLEGYGNDIESGKKRLESRIRNCVKRVDRCDLLLDGILQGTTDSPDAAPPFDVILSCLCLEVAPKDVDGYTDNLKRINKLLRSGGGLITCGFLQGETWNVGEKSFHHIKIDEKNLVDALVKAGFGNICLKTTRSKASEFVYEYDKFYCVTAMKL